MKIEQHPFNGLEKILDFLSDNLVQPEAIREFPIRDYFDKYAETVKTVKYTPFDLSLMHMKEYFERNIILPNNISYKLIWDVDKLKEIISKNHISVVALDLYERKNDITYSIENIDNYVLKNEPIILGEMGIMKTNLILDGNHRITYYFENRIQRINAYYLLSSLHYEAIVGEFMRRLFVLHNNIYKIQCFMCGYIDNLNEHLIDIS